MAERATTTVNASNFPQDGLTGKYLGTRDTTKGVIHRIGDTDVWGTAMLNFLLGEVKEGTDVTVTYAGKKKNSKGFQMHNWTVNSTEEKAPF